MNTKQTSFFSMMASSSEKNVKILSKLHLEQATEVDKRTKLLWEKELLGLYISDHPMEEFEKELNGNLTDMSSIKEGMVKQALIAGVITNIKKITTKNNDIMAFVTIEDRFGQSIEIIVFPNLYKQSSSFLLKDVPIITYGQLSDKDGEPKLLSSIIYELKTENAKETINEIKKDIQKPIVHKEQKILNIKIPENTSKEKIKTLKTLLENNKGKDFKVCFVVKDKKLDTQFCIDLNKDLANNIKEIFNN